MKAFDGGPVCSNTVHCLNSGLFPREAICSSLLFILLLIAALQSSVWCGVIYNNWWVDHLKLPRVHVPFSTYDLFLWAGECGCEGGWSSMLKPWVNEDPPHYKRMVLPTSLGMFGLKLNTSLLSGVLLIYWKPQYCSAEEGVSFQPRFMLIFSVSQCFLVTAVLPPIGRTVPHSWYLSVTE